MSLDDSDIRPQKKRKLSSICANNLLSNLFDNSQLDNVTFIVGPDKEKIPGNRTVFALQSPVLQAMLFGNMIEAKSDEIVISDITPQSFKFLKDLFYGNEKDLNVDVVCGVLYACKKYLLIDLECECYKFIENVSDLNDWWKLMQSQTLNTSKDIDMTDALIRKSKVLINNSEKVSTNIDGLIKINPEWVALIVESSSFVIEKEEIVWEMCLNYCKRYFGNKTLHSGELEMNHYFVEHIRFPLISKDYLVNKIEPLGILSFETLYQILKCLDDKTNKYKYESKYKWYPRKPYYQRFLACYDIKSLKSGDKIYSLRQNGKYLEETINSINWNDNTTRRTIGGIKSEGAEGTWYKNWEVVGLRNSWYLASQMESWAMEHTITAACGNSKHNSNVQFRCEEWLDWVDAIVVDNAYVVLDTTKKIGWYQGPK